jgi:hypothetical protein
MEVSPGCFVQPWNAKDVSAALKILNQPDRMLSPDCKFAIRSGGSVFNLYPSRRYAEI